MEINFRMLNGKKAQIEISKNEDGTLYAKVNREGSEIVLEGRLSSKNFEELCLQQENIWDIRMEKRDDKSLFWIRLIIVTPSSYE